MNDAKYLNDNEYIFLKANPNFKLKILHTPGHTPDSVVYYDEKENAAFVGDTIFKVAIGNYEYPGGNFEEIKNSIQNKIFKMPQNTTLYSGHSDKTTVKAEKERYQ